MRRVNSLSRVMEPETIEKNGTSSKSRISRGNFLRKACFALLPVVFCGLMFIGCGGNSNSPSSVVERANKAIIQKDVDAYLKCFYDISDRNVEDLRQALKEETEWDIVKFEILDESIFDNGEKAKVTFKVGMRNGSEDTYTVNLVKTKSGWKILR